ncbi:hypothetical protein DFH06DRAFT_1296378 [Mycena polygramma]|nr:hypothetical protein DFH06DRAFT_1296378 [Mycena polygramma]
MSSTTTASTSNSRRRQRDEEDECPDERPHQRARGDDPDETLVEEFPVQARRDLAFYREDGDCILRVENILFKIHRHLLNYPSSAFHGLFSLPNGAGSKVEGHDDNSPIQLSGDNPEHVRSFFHYAYSSPIDLQYSSLSSGAIDKLIGTLHFAHKYRLESFEKWASEAITQICARREVLKTCGQELYIALLELDRLCPLPPVKGTIQRRWVSRLTANEPDLSLVRALDVANQLGFRSLQGDLYYLQLQRLDVPAAGIPGTQAAPPLPAELNDTHKLRLLTGYRSLLLAWTRITATALSLEGTCNLAPGWHQHHCLRWWEAAWKETVHELGPTTPCDFQKNLDALQKALLLRCIAEREAGGCPVIHRAARSRFPLFMNTLNASMADHFLGPEEVVLD